MPVSPSGGMAAIPVIRKLWSTRSPVRTSNAERLFSYVWRRWSRRIAASRFGVLYHGDTLKVCFLEAVLRDQRDDVIGDLPIAKDEIDRRR